MRNWRTTLVGAGAAAAIVAGQGYQAFEGRPVDWLQILLAALMAALGFVAKDAGVTGTDR